MPPETQNRPVVVFVHGFGSSRDCWTRAGARPSRLPWRYKGPLIGDLASADADLAGCDLDYFEYDTRWFNFHLLRKIPTIFEVGQWLRTWLRAKQYHTRPTTLVGHSQGGLVILSYVWNVLDEKEAPSLHHVRQIVLIATPQKGSALLLSTRGLIGRVFPNPQEARLRPLNDSVDTLLAEITRDVLGAATRDEDDSWPVPIRAFYGSEDGLVSKESARGELDPGAVDSLAGDHFSVLRPVDANDPKYLAIKGAILRPIGHKHVFLIERYGATLAVTPESRDLQVDFKNRKGRIAVQTSCLLNRHVTFSEQNVCEERFLIRYRTLAPDGYVEYTPGGARERGEVGAADLQAYRDEGRQIRFLYRPGRRAHDFCFLNLVIYNGFNSGNTNAHFHLRPLDEPLRFMETLEYVIDLSAYLRQGIRIREPQLYLHPQNPAACDDLCRSRVEEDRREPTIRDAEKGVWHWTMKDVEGGVVDIFWDVPSAPPQ